MLFYLNYSLACVVKLFTEIWFLSTNQYEDTAKNARKFKIRAWPHAKTSHSVPTIFVVASLPIRVNEFWPILQRKKPGRASIGCPSGWRVTFRIPSLARRGRITDKRVNVLADKEKHLYTPYSISNYLIRKFINDWISCNRYICAIKILTMSTKSRDLYLWTFVLTIYSLTKRVSSAIID